MSKFAARTSVSPEKSRMEIERTLMRYGATGFMYGWDENRVLIQFRMKDRQVKYIQEMPVRAKFNSQSAYEQAVRQRWRSLAILIKGKLDAVENGTVSFEQEFYAFVVLPNGQTVYEETHQAVKQMYLTGQVQKLLPAATGGNA